MRNGKGELHFPNGDVFIGNFLNDKMHGEGLWKFADKEAAKIRFKKSENGLLKVKYVHGKKVNNGSYSWTIF